MSNVLNRILLSRPSVIQSQYGILTSCHHKIIAWINACWKFIIGHNWLLYEESLLKVNNLDSMVLASSDQGVRIEPGDHVGTVDLDGLCWLEGRDFCLHSLRRSLDSIVGQGSFIDFPKLDWSVFVFFCSFELRGAGSKHIWGKWVLSEAVPSIDFIGNIFWGMC